MPVVLALRQWGEKWGGGSNDVVLVDKRSGRPVRKICVQAEDGRILRSPDDLVWTSRSELEAARSGRAA
jgi:hypothetical protein